LGQNNPFSNKQFIKNLYKDTNYLRLKQKITDEFAHSKPGNWGEFVKGVDEDLVTNKKIIALTFDACGGKNADGYDADLIDYLQVEKIPATLFITGKWIDANYATFLKLAKHPLFEIENHGFNHQPCSVDGESEYGIHGTKDIPDAIDEIEANALKIEKITGRKPLFYRSATAYTDEACAKIAKQLGITIVSFDVLSGDAVPFTSKSVIENNVLKNVKPGAIIIMHFNRPKWNTFEALQVLVPELKRQGYTFAKLEDYPLKPKG
jgi:peptidoglycan/xylan/chitin deacetylase (PgdA/CDA1 family)